MHQAQDLVPYRALFPLIWTTQGGGQTAIVIVLPAKQLSSQLPKMSPIAKGLSQLDLFTSPGE